MAHLPASLATPIRAIAQQALGRDWQLYGLLLDHWPAIIGPAWAETVLPVKLTFPAVRRTPDHRPTLQGGVLTLQMPRGLALEVQYRQQQILERLDNFLGRGAIGRLHFTHSHRPAPRSIPAPTITRHEQDALLSATAVIIDPELRGALESLGQHLLAAKH